METKVEIYSKEFAEFYGIMLGDGCIYSNFQVICISGDSILDQTYHKSRVKELFINLFRKHPKFYYSKKENSLRTNLHSKELAMDLNKFGFPIGKKNKNKIIIPKHFFSNEELLKSLIRGLYDTDGTIYYHPGAKAIIEISITEENLLKEVQEIMCTLGLNMKTSTNRVYTSGKNNVINFFNVIRPVNQRHTMKYEYLLEDKKIPSSKEIESFLKY